jgi:hypothetical protein
MAPLMDSGKVLMAEVLSIVGGGEYRTGLKIKVFGKPN